MKRPTLRERLLSKAVINWETGCWEWTAHLDRNGYGKIKIDGMSRLAHRTAYEVIEGPIPPSLHLDHLCRVRNCINPAHLEPVTARENMLRSPVHPAALSRQKTCCKHGHEFTPENTQITKRGRRACRACGRAAWSRWNQRRLAKERAK